MFDVSTSSYKIVCGWLKHQIPSLGSIEWLIYLNAVKNIFLRISS